MNPVLFTEETFKIKFSRLDLNFAQRLRLSLQSDRKSTPLFTESHRVLTFPLARGLLWENKPKKFKLGKFQCQNYRGKGDRSL
jgi:hypothetical protein